MFIEHEIYTLELKTFCVFFIVYQSDFSKRNKIFDVVMSIQHIQLCKIFFTYENSKLILTLLLKILVYQVLLIKIFVEHENVTLELKIFLRIIYSVSI